jgi:hypothetical protein
MFMWKVTKKCRYGWKRRRRYKKPDNKPVKTREIEMDPVEKAQQNYIGDRIVVKQDKNKKIS